jgi:predicted metal-binding membrane protein
MAVSPAPRAAAERPPWLYGGVLAGLAGSAWVALAFLGASAYGPALGHAAGAEAGSPGVRLALFVAGWVLMSVAMMLPTSLPLVTAVHTMVRGTPGAMAWLAAGYLAVWSLFGLAAWLADAGLHELVERSAWAAARADAIPAALLLTAGLFQFSPLKYACLAECRSPVGFLIQHWRGRSVAQRALRVGVSHGLYCVGCCWALMLLMFAVGGVHLGWMLALGAVMFVEKAVRRGRLVTRPAGAALALWGLALLARLPGVPAPF